MQCCRNLKGEKGPVECFSNAGIRTRDGFDISGRRDVQKSPTSKAAALLVRGAYLVYVSTAKGREHRWRLFSTFPEKEKKRGFSWGRS